MPRRPENPEKGENPPANEPSAGEPRGLEVVAGKVAAHQAPTGRLDVRPSVIELSDLVAMFRRASGKGPCPTEDILKDRRFYRLRHIGWIKKLIMLHPREKPELQIAEEDAHKALDQLENCLHTIIGAYRELNDFTYEIFDSETRIDPLVVTFESISNARAALPTRQAGKRKGDWHPAARAIALAAKEAWQMAGETEFSTAETSPLVRITVEILGYAGQTVAAKTMAAAFGRTLLPDGTNPPTTPNL